MIIQIDPEKNPQTPVIITGSEFVHFCHLTPLKRTNQPQPHTIDDDFLIPELIKDEVRLARLQVTVLPLLVDTKFHSNPNLRIKSFKASNKDIYHRF